MRDRLIELLRQIDFDYSEECVLASENGYRCAPDFAEYFADHLLANGVIVPNATTAVDFVEVVRCKDCAKEGLSTCPICYIENHTLQFINHDPDFFCGYGEKK